MGEGGCLGELSLGLCLREQVGACGRMSGRWRGRWKEGPQSGLCLWCKVVKSDAVEEGISLQRPFCASLRT